MFIWVNRVYNNEHVGETRYEFMQSWGLARFWLGLAAVCMVLAFVFGSYTIALYLAAFSMLMAYCHWKGLKITHTFFIVLGACTGAVGIIAGEPFMAVIGFAGMFIWASGWVRDKLEQKKRIEEAAENGMTASEMDKDNSRV